MSSSGRYSAEMMLILIQNTTKMSYLHRQPRDERQREQRHAHGHGPEGEQLHLGDGVPAGVVDEGGQAQHLLPPGEAHQSRHDVGCERAVRVAVLLEVHHHQQLREQDHVYQVRAHGPGREEHVSMLLNLPASGFRDSGKYRL